MDDESSVQWACGILGGILVLVAIGLSLGNSESVGADATTNANSWKAKAAWLDGGFGSLV
jgi:hypothetical protein